MPISREPTHGIGFNADRKMCVVIQHHLAKGARCAPPLDPPDCGASRASSPFPRHPTVSPVDHSQGDVALPCTPSIRRAYRRPLNPTRIVWPLHRHSGRSLRAPPRPPWPGRRRSPLDPIDQRACHGPLEPSTRLVPPGPHHGFAHGDDQGAFEPLGSLTNPARVGCAPAFRRWTPTRLCTLDRKTFSAHSRTTARRGGAVLLPTLALAEQADIRMTQTTIAFTDGLWPN